ncbi:MAG TPA: RpiB/LacA/LacB family sugar-phosphate isomerase [Terriglobia bacterium]|nr:RpiB/LacA/LacB family sugar-phosphate isomerase [Terriglobia bacterium]
MKFEVFDDPDSVARAAAAIIAADSRGAAGHEVVDFGAYELNQGDDYPDFVTPLARAVAAGTVEQGVGVCGSGVGASVCANKIRGVRAALVEDHFSTRQGVEDDHMNIICMGARTVGPLLAWDLVETFLAAEFSQAERHLRRLKKVASLEPEVVSDGIGAGPHCARRKSVQARPDRSRQRS